jgi:hypothetical protein
MTVRSPRTRPANIAGLPELLSRKAKNDCRPGGAELLASNLHVTAQTPMLLVTIYEKTNGTEAREA